MLRHLLLITTIMLVVKTSISAKCSKGCTCPTTSSVVECNTLQLEPFGMHVFSLKISHPSEPLILKDQVFNIKGLEKVNTISIENATILEIQKSALAGVPLLSTLEIINCNIPELKASAVFSNATNLRTLKISNSTLEVFENVNSEHLEELVLSNNKLKVISNNTFSGLPSLTYIDISDNVISVIDSLAFSKLQFLLEVHFANNNITSLASDLFKANSDLVTLDLSNNPLKIFDINITADLEKLELQSCQLEKIDQKVTLALDYLSYLDLSNNKISFTNTAFNNMTELDYINLSNNNLATLDHNIFRKNYKLQKIILDDNNFVVLPKFECSGGNFETYLFSCNNCGISSLPVDTFRDFPALVTLSLANNHITSAHLSAFNHLSSVIDLNLSHNKISTLQPNAFSMSTALEKLNLADNPISSIDPTVFENNRVLKTLDISSCSIHQLWNHPTKNALSSLRQLILTNNFITTITLSDLAVMNSIEVLDVSNNPLQCDNNLKEMITWLNDHAVAAVTFKTHEEINTIDTIDFDGTNHWSWRELAKEKCSKEYYLANYETKHPETEIIKKTTKAPDDYDYHYGDFDSDEDAATSDEESDEVEQLSKDVVGMKISEILSSSKNKDHPQYSFLWPTLVFIFTSLSVLVIAANIMLLMLRSTSLSRNINIPHIKIPQWNSSTKLKKHSGSVYQPLSEEKYDSCISIAARKEQVPTHMSNQNNIP